MSDEYVKLNGNTQDEATEAFKFENKGDEVEGVFVDKKDIASTLSASGKSTIYTVQKEDGTFVSFFGTSVIDDNMNRVPLGSQIKIVYLGKEKSKTGPYSYKNFDIFSKNVKPTEKVQTETAEGEINPDDVPF